jgi:acetyl esterase/lipase
LLYPEARVPFNTPAAVENNSGYYLECNGIFSIANNYLPRGAPPSTRYVSTGMQSVKELSDQVPAAVYTSEFVPFRDVGVEYAHNLKEAGNKIIWRHCDDMIHGWLQMTAWSDAAVNAVRNVAEDVNTFAYGK